MLKSHKDACYQENNQRGYDRIIGYLKPYSAAEDNVEQRRGQKPLQNFERCSHAVIRARGITVNRARERIDRDKRIIAKNAIRYLACSLVLPFAEANYKQHGCQNTYCNPKRRYCYRSPSAEKFGKRLPYTVYRVFEISRDAFCIILRRKQVRIYGILRARIPHEVEEVIPKRTPYRISSNKRRQTRNTAGASLSARP